MDTRVNHSSSSTVRLDDIVTWYRICVCHAVEDMTAALFKFYLPSHGSGLIVRHFQARGHSFYHWDRP